LVFGILPAFGRIRFAMPGHVKGQYPEFAGDLGIAQHVPVLAVVGACRVQADQGYAGSRLFDIHPATLARDVKRKIAARDGFEGCAHAASRPSASKSLMY